MIYLLSGLLVIHGIVCLLSAFFPFYPPVYLFYAFFPGHFAIRLVIVLLIGAAQIVYGLYLVLRKRRRLRWYWPAVATVVIAGVLLIFPAVENPGLFGISAGKDAYKQPIPYTVMPFPVLQGKEAPDDIVYTPGGAAYRANVHAVSANGTILENPWPPVESTDAVLGGGGDTINVHYRDYIETASGETRNNIILVTKEGGLSDRKLALYSVDSPAGMGLTDGGRGAGLPGALGAILVINISPDVQAGQYSFEIGIEIDGKDYGTVPCTVLSLR